MTRTRMTRTLQFAVGLLSGASLVALGAAEVSADHMRKLSAKHTNYGVAQYNWASLRRQLNLNCSACMSLMNPTHVDQIAAVLMYQRPTSQFTEVCIEDPDATAAPFCIDEPFLSEVFMGCFVVELTANGALSFPNPPQNDWPVAGEDWPGCPGGLTHDEDPADNNSADATSVPRTAEAIWGPVEKVVVPGLPGPRRRADGLGGALAGDIEGVLHLRAQGLLHPGLFSLPSDSVVAGQKDAAIVCVCAGLSDLFADRNTFEKFGIACP